MPLHADQLCTAVINRPRRVHIQQALVEGCRERGVLLESIHQDARAKAGLAHYHKVAFRAAGGIVPQGGLDVRCKQ